MGLTLTIGASSSALLHPSAKLASEKIKAELDILVPVRQFFGRSRSSEELAWSGWSKLQASATEILGAERIPHILAVDAWFGVYLPAPIQPTAIVIGDNSPPLQCASLSLLVPELEHYGKKRGLPTDDQGLKAMRKTYITDDNMINQDFDVQVYLQLLPLARLGQARGLALWVVK